METDLGRLGRQIETLFRLDAAGRLLSTNEAVPRPAPRFFLGRTREGNVARYRHDLPDGVVAALERVVWAEPVAADLSDEPPVTDAALRAVLAGHAPIGAEWRGPAYRFPSRAETAAATTGRDVVAIDRDTLDLLPEPFAWLRGELPTVWPCLAAVAEDRAVAVCHAARRTARAAEAGVETLPAFRGRGYGTAAVAAWAVAVRRAGLAPLYSTSWENAASRRLAARLGLVVYAEDFHLA